MKLPSVRVTVNSGEYEGMSGLVVGYDRNKYYRVMLDNGASHEFKAYYLSGIDKIRGNTRYLLQYNDYEVPLTHEELTEDKNLHTGKGKGFHRKFRYFNIYVGYGDHEECLNRLIFDKFIFNKLSFEQLKSKVRMVMQNGYPFMITMSTHTKNSGVFTTLLTYKNDSLTAAYHSKKDRLYYETFERGLMKVINEY